MSEDQIVGGQEESVVSSKKTLDPGFKRNLFIIGGAAVAAVAAVVIMLSSGGGQKSSSPSPSNVRVGGAGQVTSSTTMSPVMSDMLEEKERQEADEARRRGLSYFPPDPRPVKQIESPVLSPQVGMSAMQQEAYMGPSRAGQESLVESYQRQREGLERQLEALVAISAPSGGVRQRVEATPTTIAAANAQTAQSAGSDGGGERNAKTTLRPFIRGHYIAAGILSNVLVVPAGKTVYASSTIMAGPLSGAFLTGTAVVVDEGLSLKFDKMSFDGRFYTVDVTALDENTSANALSGNVDRRLLQRWVMPVAMATVGKFFDAKAQTGTTIVNVGGGLDEQTQGLQTPAPTQEQAKSAGIAAGISIAQREVEKSAQAPIVVSEVANKAIGLLFNAPVYHEKDEK